MSERKHELIIAALGIILLAVMIIYSITDYPDITPSGQKSDIINTYSEKVLIPDEIETEIIFSEIYVEEEAPSDSQSLPDKECESDSELPVNINTASVEELTGLEGIGNQKAKAIVEYRERCNGFYIPEEITEVDGISEKLYEKIADDITVS